MDDLMKEELDYIQRHLGKKEHNAKIDCSIFMSWEDSEITTSQALTYFLKNNKIPAAHVSDDTFVYFAKHLGYTGRRTN